MPGYSGRQGGGVELERKTQDFKRWVLGIIMLMGLAMQSGPAHWRAPK